MCEYAKELKEVEENRLDKRIEKQHLMKCWVHNLPKMIHKEILLFLWQNERFIFINALCCADVSLMIQSHKNEMGYT